MFYSSNVPVMSLRMGYGMSLDYKDDQHALMQIKSKSRTFHDLPKNKHFDPIPNPIHSRVCSSMGVNVAGNIIISAAKRCNYPGRSRVTRLVYLYINHAVAPGQCPGLLPCRPGMNRPSGGVISSSGASYKGHETDH